MKFLALSIALLPLTAAASLAQITPPQCDGYTSYWLTSSGECVGLDSFTRLGNIQQRIEGLERQITPIIGQNLNLRRESVAGINSVYIEASLVNQSSESQRVYLAHFGIFRQVDGRTVREGSQSVGIGQDVAPGQAIPVDAISYRVYPPNSYLRLESVDSIPTSQLR